MDDVSDLVRRLADVQDRMLALDPRDLSARYELEKERDALRSEASEFAGQVDEGRSATDIERELAALRAQVEAIIDSKIDLVVQSGGGSNAGPGADGMGGVVLNQLISAAGGMDRIRARISHLEAVLERKAAQPEA